MERLRHNFQVFRQTIHDWPTSTIAKHTLLQLFNDFLNENPELQNDYDVASVPDLPDKAYNSRSGNYSQIDPTDSSSTSSSVSNPLAYITFDPPQPIRKDSLDAAREPSVRSNSSVSKLVIKQGDLTVKKSSSVLQPLIKKQGLKAIVYCELATASQEGQQWVYFTVYQTQKSQKVIHKFILDHDCSFAQSAKREFSFKHGSLVESFTTEDGLADSWIAAFNSAIIRPENIEEIYEIPEDMSVVSPAMDKVVDTPLRPPPRPVRRINTISPEQIYVCLYDHSSTGMAANELQFHRGDLLYLINTEGPNFYVGHKLTLPWDPHHQPSLGLVYREYIRPAYEKAY